MGASAGPSLTTAGPEATGESEGDTGAGGESVGELEGEKAMGPEEEEEGMGVVGRGDALGATACGNDDEALGVATGEPNGD